MLTQAAGNCWSHSFFFCSDIFGFWVKNNHLFARWMQTREKNFFNNHRLKAGFIKRSILAFYLRIGLQQNMWHVTSVPSVKTSEHFVRLRLRTKKNKSIADTFSSQMSSHLFSSALQMEAFDFSPQEIQNLSLPCDTHLHTRDSDVYTHLRGHVRRVTLATRNTDGSILRRAAWVYVAPRNTRLMYSRTSMLFTEALTWYMHCMYLAETIKWTNKCLMIFYSRALWAILTFRYIE